MICQELFMRSRQTTHNILEPVTNSGSSFADREEDDLLFERNKSEIASVINHPDGNSAVRGCATDWPLIKQAVGRSVASELDGPFLRPERKLKGRSRVSIWDTAAIPTVPSPSTLIATDICRIYLAHRAAAPMSVGSPNDRSSRINPDNGSMFPFRHVRITR
jgi:hypothetical protein